jgi:ligand-binding sensor protein
MFFLVLDSTGCCLIEGGPMNITDLLPAEQWVDVEKDINERSGLCAAVFDDKGVRVTTFVRWSNVLCPRIKGDPRGLSQVCAVANQTMSGMARQSRQPVIDECDAGMAKVVVPIYVNGEFLGTMGGCGLLLEDGEVDTFLVSKTIECTEEETERLSQGIERISHKSAAALALYLMGRIDEIVRDGT